MMEKTTIIIEISLKEGVLQEFAKWQADFHAAIVHFKGFISLEIIAPTPSKENWQVIQRFDLSKSADLWRTSEIYKTLYLNLSVFCKELKESLVQNDDNRLGVTEVFVTEVSSEKTEAFKHWLSKIHQVESTFPGFKGVYIQSPTTTKGNFWITLLQFDTQQNLDRWISSKEREAILEESMPLIKNLESHRMLSPFGGWFAKASENENIPVWKQTLLVLLVLYPIVMLELKFLSPYTTGLDLSLATFIGNAISVTLVSWPMMPIVIYFLKWWLAPSPNKGSKNTLLGLSIVLSLYIVEILIFFTH